MSEQVTEAATWAVVELMGHVKLAGKLSEVERFGSKMGRLDIPQIPILEGDDETFVTQFFGGGSVYRITFVTESVARDVARRSQPAPVQPWDYPKQLATSAKPANFAGTGDDEDDIDIDHPY